MNSARDVGVGQPSKTFDFVQPAFPKEAADAGVPRGGRLMQGWESEFLDIT